MNNLLNYSRLRALFSPALFSRKHQQTTPKNSEAGSMPDCTCAYQHARSAVYLYKGNGTHQHIVKRLNIYHKYLDLLIAAHA